MLNKMIEAINFAIKEKKMVSITGEVCGFGVSVGIDPDMVYDENGKVVIVAGTDIFTLDPNIVEADPGNIYICEMENGNRLYVELY